jgi:hypothetical protein
MKKYDVLLSDGSVAKLNILPVNGTYPTPESEASKWSTLDKYGNPLPTIVSITEV